MSYDIEILKNTFKILENSSFEGVSGVVKFDGLSSGPCVGITICTHGNEPSGLAVATFLIDYFSREKLLRGTLYLVLNNIEATRKYLNANTDKEKVGTRYVDVNMNRLPEDVLELVNDKRYEVRRAQELVSVWKKFDVALDVHSTTLPTDPMIISNGGNFEGIKDLISGFPINILISNIDEVQIGVPAATLYGDRSKGVRIMAIEAGQHELDEAFDCAIRCAVSLLQNLEMVVGTTTNGPSQIKEYFINGSLIFPDHSFDLVKEFKTFDEFEEGEVLARNSSGQEVLAPFDGHIIMPTIRRGLDKNISEEVAFLSRLVENRDLK